jgi:phosphoribosyl 1,2-cyclic phosphodiesterase
VLVDCGFSLRELEMRLLRAGVSPAQLDAVFITHEHADHIGCAVALTARYRVALWMSRGTHVVLGEPEMPAWRCARDGEAIRVRDLELTPYTVPHDAREPLQLTCSDGAARLGILTDAGSVTQHLVRQLQRCDALLLECNHDREMLATSDYPPSLKARIGSTHGHLANDTAAQILALCRHSALRHVVAAHLSERNNTPALATKALADAVGTTGNDVVVADPLRGFDWLSLH